MVPRTVFIFETFTESAKFYLAYGNYTHFNGVYINEYHEGPDAEKKEELANRLAAFMYAEETGEINADVLAELDLSAAAHEIRTGADVIQCGFFP